MKYGPQGKLRWGIQTFWSTLIHSLMASKPQQTHDLRLQSLGYWNIENISKISCFSNIVIHIFMCEMVVVQIWNERNIGRNKKAIIFFYCTFFSRSSFWNYPFRPLLLWHSQVLCHFLLNKFSIILHF